MRCNHTASFSVCIKRSLNRIVVMSCRVIMNLTVLSLPANFSHTSQVSQREGTGEAVETSFKKETLFCQWALCAVQ